MVRQTATIVFFEILGGLLFLAVAACAFLAWRLAQGPVELTAFKDEIEQALSQARDGRKVELERVQLQWSPERRRIDIAARGLVFRDAAQVARARIDRADITLSASSLLLGDVEIVALDMHGGNIELRQLSATDWTIAGEPLPPIPEGQLPQTPREWLELTNRYLLALMSGAGEVISGIELERVALERIRLDVTDRSAEPLAKLAGVSGRLVVDDGDLSLSGAARGQGGGMPAGFAFDVATSGRVSSVDVEIGFADGSIAGLSRRAGISPTRLSGLPADIAFTARATRARGLERVSVVTEAGRGALTLAGRNVAVSRIAGRMDYLKAEDTLMVRLATLDAGPLRGEIIARVDNALEAEDRRTLNLSSSDLRIDATPMFERPWRLRDLDVEALIDPSFQGLDISRARFRIGSARVRASGRIARASGPGAGELPLTADIAAELDGPAGKRDVLDFWPVALGDGARRFLVQKVEAGRLVSARARLRLREDSLAQGFLEDDALDVSFSVAQVRVRPLPDIPPIEAASGTGYLTGNSFRIDIDRAEYSSISINSGEVDFPRLNPKGEDFHVTATGTGDIVPVVKSIFNSRLQLETATGFDPDRLSGQARGTFRLSRPALEKVAPGALEFSVRGEVRDAGLTDIADGLHLTAATTDIDLDETRLAVSGFGQLGPATVNFDWRDSLGNDGEPSRLAARSVVTPDILNRFGLLGRPYVSGQVPVELTARLDGETVYSATARLDLDDARIDLAEIGWLKPPGEPASAEIDYAIRQGGRHAATRLDSENARLVGDVLLGEDGRLLKADLERAYLEGRADVSGELARGEDGALAFSLTGPFLDVSNAMPDFGAIGNASGFSRPLTLDAEVERLALGDGLEMMGARLAAISTAQGLQSFVASGTSGDDAPMEARYELQPDGSADIGIESGNAGFLFRAMLGIEFLDDGRLSVSGRLRPSAPSQFDITIRDARLRDAPFLTQILSLGSLRGLADTLGGDGVLFSEIILPLRVGSGRWVVDGGRASGPALGLTANGWLEPETGALNFDGVLVPSFGVNSALGDIPIIGDLVVGREGEGIFSLTYSVRGSLDRAQVAVNPLSAVTPGVLRRIFENPAETELPLPEAGEAEN
ncbi:MAG: hypothetical protein GVY06_06645 [Alphaproteobacteria bacterium]|nr:hypothetical protein [Alphaproteobacteria bacterium]